MSQDLSFGKLTRVIEEVFDKYLERLRWIYMCYKVNGDAHVVRIQPFIRLDNDETIIVGLYGDQDLGVLLKSNRFENRYLLGRLTFQRDLFFFLRQFVICGVSCRWIPDNR